MCVCSRMNMCVEVAQELLDFSHPYLHHTCRSPRCIDCRWYEMSCLTLRDPAHGINLQTCSQPTFIPSQYVMAAQDQTPSDYPLRWAGLAVTVGQVSLFLLLSVLRVYGVAEWIYATMCATCLQHSTSLLISHTCCR